LTAHTHILCKQTLILDAINCNLFLPQPSYIRTHTILKAVFCKSTCKAVIYTKCH